MSNLIEGEDIGRILLQNRADGKGYSYVTWSRVGMMKKLGIGSLALMLAVSMAAPMTATAGPMRRRDLAARDGDNTVYLRWNADKRRITEASSSRRITSDQRVELLTSVSDRSARIGVRAVLRNISDDTIYVVDGRLTHHVYEDGKEIKTFRSRPFQTSLRPGEKIVAHFSYMLRSGEYSVRTDLMTE